jgi:hypothetical protein
LFGDRIGAEQGKDILRRLTPAVLVVLSVLVAVSVATAAAPAPVLVAPSDGHEFPPPDNKGPVTFKVDGQADEPAGSLHIQIATADAEVDAKGSFQDEESGVDDYTLEQTAPGSTHYQVTVPAEDFARYSGGELYWQAYRVLPEGSCTDCFQESAKPRTFELLQPSGYGAYEPNNSAAKATASTEYFNHDCAYLEEPTDVDWYRYKGARRGLKLRLKLRNWSDSDRWVALKSRKRESADMKVALYKEAGMRKVASRHVKVGKTGVLKATLRPKTPYLFVFRHAGNGFKSAKPAANMSYLFDINLPGDFSDANGCT